MSARGLANPWLCAAVLLAAGCAKTPPGRFPIDRVRVLGAEEISSGALLDQIATAPSAKFLGLFRGVVYDYEIYDASVLQRDLARIERYYRGHGFFSAHARAARIERTADAHVRVEIVVDEGLPTLNREVIVDGLDGLPESVAAAVRRTAQRGLRSGRRFDEEKFDAATNAIRRALTDAGYAYAKVTPDASLDIGARTMDYRFTLQPGPAATFGSITFEGLDPDGPGPREQELDEARLRQALNIVPGEPYSTATLEAATQALLDLGVFSAVTIEPTLTEPPAPESPPVSLTVPLTVKVEPARLRQIRLGGGLNFDQLKTEVHALTGWQDRNFLGGLRDFSVDFQPGVVLWPMRVNNLVKPERLLPEERLRLQLRQPGFVEARTNGYLRPEFNVYPLLVNADAAPDAAIVGYREMKLAAGVDRRFSKLFANFGYNVQVEWPFTYQGSLDPALDTLVLLFPQLITTLDFRDNPTHPHSGAYLSNTLELAGIPLRGSATDLRIQPEVRAYLPLGRRITLASRGSLGFLIPSNYGDVVENRLAEQLTDENRAARVRDIQIVYLRGFASGGANSNRGYPYRGIAPHGVVPFLNPSTASQQLALHCDPSQGSPDPSICAIPIGGFTLWELSVEARFGISGPFAASTFCDAGDVSPHTADLRFDHMHLSCGFGLRYDTPVGPLRLDVGYRIQPLQVLGFADEIAAGTPDLTHPERAVEGIPPRLWGGLPIAIAFGIGEAY